jgi:hypothetical protein
MTRTILNLCIDLLAGFLFLGMMLTGYILRFPLPPGTNKLYTLWGLTRHQWGSIHSWISLALLVVILIHVAMHWTWIVSVISKRLFGNSLQDRSVTKIGIFVFLCIIACFSLFAVQADKNVKQISAPRPETCPPDFSTAETKDFSYAKSPAVNSWREVSSIFQKNCVHCHGPVKQFSDFRADRYEDFFKGYGSSPLITPGNMSKSRLLEIVTGKRKDIPAYKKHLLKDDEIQVISNWIASGAAKQEIETR